VTAAFQSAISRQPPGRHCDSRPAIWSATLLEAVGDQQVDDGGHYRADQRDHDEEPAWLSAARVPQRPADADPAVSTAGTRVPAMTRRGDVLAVGLSALACLLVLTFAAPTVASTPPLSQFLLRSGEQPGYDVSSSVQTVTSAASFMKGSAYTAQQAANAVKTLKRAGFVEAAEENITGSGGLVGFAMVMEFKSAAGARTGASVFAHLATLGAGPTPRAFKVPAVTSARGETQIGGSGGTANAYWYGGRCLFGSGLFDPNAATASAATVALPVVDGITAQHARVGASCP
jgi:hypothetical protein